jgi:hypothetical protein
MCENDRKRTIVRIDDFVPEMWYHFAFSVTQQGAATLAIYDKQGLVAID